MNLIDFINQYPYEESCKEKFKQYRDQGGVCCAKCGSSSRYWKKDKEQYECKYCGTRTKLKSGTVMHKSKLPYRYWFLTMHLLTSTKKCFSAKEIQRQLGLNIKPEFLQAYLDEFCYKFNRRYLGEAMFGRL